MSNRLSASTSPYLQQHAGNPVDWWPWCEEAFAEARRRDVPVLLSVGYSACHWCHVMAHESFEDERVAAVVNELCVPVKVDREERPDVDSVYMSATLATTGHGGWPMTCFLTPDGAPFHAGTYYPRDTFVGLVRAAHDAWRGRRTEVEDASRRLVDALHEHHPAPDAEITARLTEAALERLTQEYDARHGGFGGAPKFPPSMVLDWLLRHHAGTGSAEALALADGTLTAMARGGIHDQLAGGFARYAVDASWTVPHFEKMLYDNAQLLRVYARWWAVGGSPLARRTAQAVAAFLLREMRTPEGAFASGLDADTGGVEGATYVWTPAELTEVLGDEDGAWAAQVFSVTREGSFEHGTSVLRLDSEPADAERLEGVRGRLLAARQRRAQPGRDDKVVASWNGLAVGALAEAGMLLGDPPMVDAARGAADAVLSAHLVDGRLRRTSRDGVAGEAGAVLDDLGNLAEGLLVLSEVTGEGRYRDAARALLDDALAHHADGAGGFFDTADDAERLVLRPRTETDNAEPGGTSAVAAALLRLASHTGEDGYREAGIAALGRLAHQCEQAPRFSGWALAAMETLLAGSVEVAVTDGDGAEDLAAAAWRHAAPGQATVSGPEGSAPLLKGRAADASGRAQAFVCRGRTCAAPVTSADDLAALLAAR